MKIISILLLLVTSLTTIALPASGATATPSMQDDHSLAADTLHDPTNTIRSSRFSCGQYKFADNTVQEFYSQVWAGMPADQMVCRHFKYEFRDKKGQDGVMVAAKVDFGCTCFFYEQPCDPNLGHAEAWVGWMGWQNYVATDKKFKGWYCFEKA